MERQPFARVPDGQAPGQVAPEVELHLRRADDLRQLGQQLVAERVDGRIQLGARHDSVDPAPFERLPGADRLVEQQHLARAPVPDEQRQPLGGAAGRHAAARRADVAEDDVVRGHGQVAGQVELVAAADGHPVEPRHDRLGAGPDGVDGGDEVAHPGPVVVGALEEGGLLGEVGAGAEGALAGAGQDDDPDPVVRRRLAHVVREGIERRAVEGVVDVRPVEPDRRPPADDVVVDGHPAPPASSSSSGSTTMVVARPGAISRRLRPGRAHRLAGDGGVESGAVVEDHARDHVEVRLPPGLGHAGHVQAAQAGGLADERQVLRRVAPPEGGQGLVRVGSAVEGHQGRGHRCLR